MDQRDPNTVSGLLKLHLRENGMLSPESMETLMPHLVTRDVVRLQHTVMVYITLLSLSLFLHPGTTDRNCSKLSAVQ